MKTMALWVIRVIEKVSGLEHRGAMLAAMKKMVHQASALDRAEGGQAARAILLRSGVPL